MSTHKVKTIKKIDVIFIYHHLKLIEIFWDFSRDE